jgi:cation diffusion facilitator family transporter
VQAECGMSEADCAACAAVEDVRQGRHLAPGYRRALWIVIALNLGSGVIEGAGGFIAGSQALKADALDFLGDGFITLLGLLAIGWSVAWRARAALVQGVFLGVLGVLVIGSTIYRMIAQVPPEPHVMGIFAAGAFVANVAAAAVLIPHRTGDASVRAVWLFSRNDAIGNLAVLAAAGVVAVTGSAWPDLAVALFMASLFMHASWSIVREARNELADQPPD